MRKKIAWLVAVCLGVGFISYAAFGFDNNTVSAELSQQAKGSFVRADDNGKKLVVSVDGKETVYPASSTIWVYRDMQKSDLSQLKAGDSLEIILNSKDQAAYVKAVSASADTAVNPQGASGAPARQSQQPASGAAASEQAQAGTNALSAGAVAGTAAAGSSTGREASAGGAPTPASGSTAAGAAPAWEKLSVEWKSRELDLRVKQSDSGSKTDSELYLKRNDRSVIHLNGEAAAAMIQLLLKGLPADHAAFEKALKQKIATEFQLKDTTPEWKLDVKWKAAPASVSNATVVSPNPQGKAKGLDKDKEKETAGDKNKDKSKEDDKGKGKEKPHKNDGDDE
ncbi:hypothetical protein [Paenibacillus rigui]|uniref:DUF4340 domain-containing protein n=1 Tax=Paenibacillus rigui TaxID=554312 RepID=A0A229UJH4_9BACL|nr:hypothetical protein [Paenibacillus rigui]OXM83533.1 hypothetical protein CF651_24790 [Paenibacillus rigui]